MNRHDDYEIHYEYGTIFALPPTPTWMIQMLEEAKEADIQSWGLLADAVGEEQIENDRVIFALIEIATRLQQIH